jgi:hypothetical protein
VEKIIAFWEFENKLNGSINPFMKNIGMILHEEGYDHRPELFIQEWGEAIKKDAAENKIPTVVRLNLPLQRTLVTYLQYSLEKIHIESITN